ncbi:ATP-binding protein [Gracilimonas sediminicola]|uniref:ATP-binding protein n=1 Tax=Gracilimonas sediminicola TaxID=2952158 RepID=UPI0038D48DD5
MSNVIIKRAVENIRSGTNVYTPIIELVVNSIQAIEEKGNVKEGEVRININRSGQVKTDKSERDITGFTIEDNGIGFTPKNRESFDTLYTDKKIKEGGKGFGRFTCLKYFEDVHVSSTFADGDTFLHRTFKMGKQTEIIVDEDITKSDSTETGTKIELKRITTPIPERTVTTISRVLVEKLLPFFIKDDKKCPNIYLEDESGEKVLLNDMFSRAENPEITEVKDAKGRFKLEANQGEEKEFTVRVFKIYSAKSQSSKISLVAHRREVTSTSTYHYIPEFSEEFFDSYKTNGQEKEANYIIKVYVFGQYLDDNVSLERGGFEFQKENDLLFGISQTEIEREASAFAKNTVSDEVENRQEKKRKDVFEYVKEHAPWYSDLVNEVDFADVPYNPQPQQIESQLHKKKYEREVKVKAEVQELLESNEQNELKEKAAEIVEKISGSSRDELVHYIALRRSVLDILDKSLSLDPDGNYYSEDVVHDIIFPRKGDSESTPYDKHNLWIVDERLNFNHYLASDIALDGPRTERPDLLIFDKRIGFRGDNEPSNPVTIFEFKRPHRDDFVNASSNEDPVEQIIRYVNNIKKGKYKTHEGREIQIAPNTPFYGYVICELTTKVKDWLEEVKDFKPLPDRMGYFSRHGNQNIYIEVLSWEKVLKDSTMRNKVFFHKLGLE